MATVGVPDGGDPNVSSPDAGGGGRSFNKPKKSGQYNGQQVRWDGYVWDWDQRRGWAQMRETKASDVAAIPPASVGLADGYKKGDWQKRQEQDTDTPPAGGGTGGGSGGGGGGGNAGGGGAADDKPAKKNPDPDTLRGIPDGAKIWKVKDNYFAVYIVPNSRPPIRLAYRFRNEAEAHAIIAGKGIDAQNVTPAQFRKAGAVTAGPVDFITNQSEHPFDRFKKDFAREVRFKPWLADPDFMALIARSILEGREPSLSEIQETEWYQSHTGLERQKLEQYYGDRKSWVADRKHWSKVTQEKLEAAGFDRRGRGRVAAYLSGELMFGRLREDDLDREVERISNPLANQAAGSAGRDAPGRGRAVNVNGEIFWRVKGPGGKTYDYRMTDVEEAKYGGGAVKAGKVHGNNGTGVKGFGGLLREDGAKADYLDSIEGFSETRQMVLDMIGPVLAKSWGQGRIARWAQAIQDNPAEKGVLEGKLRAMRASHYKGYDPELSYRDIADMAQAQVYETLGTRLDESQPIFQQVAQMNDQAEASKVLWQHGLDTGNQKVTQRALNDLSEQMGGGVRRSMV